MPAANAKTYVPLIYNIVVPKKNKNNFLEILIAKF